MCLCTFVVDQSYIQKNEMEREELIRRCRYYKGESANPYEGKDKDASMFRGYELAWVETFEGDYEDPELSRADYLANGSVKDANEDPLFASVPVSLQQLLFNRYVQWLGGYQPIEEDLKGFIRWMQRTYLRR